MGNPAIIPKIRKHGKFCSPTCRAADWRDKNREKLRERNLENQVPDLKSRVKILENRVETLESQVEHLVLIVFKTKEEL